MGFRPSEFTFEPSTTITTAFNRIGADRSMRQARKPDLRLLDIRDMVLTLPRRVRLESLTYLRQKAIDDLRACERCVGERFVATGVLERQHLVVDAELPQDRGMQIGDADSIDGRFVTHFVGRAVDVSGLEASPRQKPGTVSEKSERIALLLRSACGPAEMRRSAFARVLHVSPQEPRDERSCGTPTSCDRPQKVAGLPHPSAVRRHTAPAHRRRSTP